MSDQYAGFEPDPVYPSRFQPQGWGARVSSLRCGCTPDRSCRRCDGTASEEWTISRLSAADRRDLDQQMVVFRKRIGDSVAYGPMTLTDHAQEAST